MSIVTSNLAANRFRFSNAMNELSRVLAGRYRYCQFIRTVTVVFPLCLVVAVMMQPWVEPRWLFMDTVTAGQLSGDCCHVYYGFVSNLGIMLWAATAAVCLFAGVLLIVRHAATDQIRFAISAALFTGWLALDDVFLLHEKVLPKLGIEQNWVLIAYLSVGFAYAIINIRQIFKADFVILAIGAGAMLSSVLIDMILHSVAPAVVSIEDGAKFLGICAWAIFHSQAMFSIVCEKSDLLPVRLSWAIGQQQGE